MIIKQYNLFTKPGYDKYVNPWIQFADIVLQNSK